MTGEGAQNPEREEEPQKAPKRKQGKASTVSGMVNARRAGEDMAVLAEPRLKKLPFYFPGKVTNRSQYVNEHAAHLLAARRGRPSCTAPTGSSIVRRRAGRVLGRPGPDVAQPADPRQPGPRSARRPAAAS